MTFMRKPVLLRKADWCSAHALQGIANKVTFSPQLFKRMVKGCLCRWNFRKCSAPVLAEHICGQQRESGLWRWNVLPSSHPSWPSIASACYKFLPQVRGPLPGDPSWSELLGRLGQTLILQGTSGRSLAWSPHPPSRNGFHQRGGTKLDVTDFYLRRLLSHVELPLNSCCPGLAPGCAPETVRNMSQGATPTC